jgi:glutamate-1-semialdehyde 2,1-aminomutase
MNLQKSIALYNRAGEIIPNNTNTNAKRRDNFLDAEHFPAYLEKAKGAYVWDLDGNKYIDYVAALSPINIGYNDERINEKLKQQLEKGSIFSLPSANEVELAELLIKKIPSAEMVRLLKTGAEVTSAAVRAARHYTGKEMILSCGYHGWHDWWSAKMGTKGIPNCMYDLIKDFPYNDFETLKNLVDQFDGQIACIIMTASDYGTAPKNDFLQKIRKLADEKNIVLIFDEIVTGFRWSLGGAQEKFAVTPDLAAFGKGMANGMPIAALVGKKEIMTVLKDNFVTSTFASEALSIVASMETIRILEEEKILDKLNGIASRIYDGLKSISQKQGIDINVNDLLPALKFSFDFPIEKEKSDAAIEFMKYCTEKGILLKKYGAEFYLCPIAALSEKDIQFTLEVFSEAVKSM